MFCHRNTSAGEFRISRRGRRWYIECEGDVLGAFASADDAALALAECELLWPHATNIPGDLREWTRGPNPEPSADAEP
jgi:hypothetical protein